MLLISCACLFLCTSGIHAADVGSASADNSSAIASDDAIDIMPNAAVDETPNQDACSMMDSADSVIADHNSHHINKTYFIHNPHGRNSDMGNHHDHKIRHNNSDFKIKDNFKMRLYKDGQIFDHENPKYHIVNGFAFNDSQAMDDIEKIRIDADIVNVSCLNDACSFCSTDPCNRVTKELDFCCCGKMNCHCHDLNDCVDNILGIGSHIVDDFACLCDFYTQANVVNDTVVRFQKTNVGESIHDVLTFSHAQNSNQRQGVNVVIGYQAHPNIDLCSNLTNSAYGIFSKCSCNGLDIGSLQGLNLDIKDYNLEYYMFTNPDIIIKRANTAILAKANTLISNNNINHFLKTFDVKIAIHRITLNNFFSTNSKIRESLTVMRIIEDNYASLNITTFLQRTASLNEGEIYYSYNGQAENLPESPALFCPAMKVLMPSYLGGKNV